jgi:hypothetical protein
VKLTLGRYCAQLQQSAPLVRNCGLGTARFAELAAGAGVRAYGVPSHAAGGRCLQILANAGAAKNGPMRELDRLGGGLIALLWCDVVWRALVLFSSTVVRTNEDTNHKSSNRIEGSPPTNN